MPPGYHRTEQRALGSHYALFWMPSYWIGLNMKQIFTVTGMTCGHCEKAVTRAVHQVDPQAQVHIEREHNRVEVESTQKRDTLAAAIAEQGYAVTPM